MLISSNKLIVSNVSEHSTIYFEGWQNMVQIILRYLGIRSFLHFCPIFNKNRPPCAVSSRFSLAMTLYIRPIHILCRVEHVNPWTAGRLGWLTNCETIFALRRKFLLDRRAPRVRVRVIDGPVDTRESHNALSLSLSLLACFNPPSLS